MKRSHIGIAVLTLVGLVACNRTRESSPNTPADAAAPLRQSDAALHALSAKIEAHLSGDDKQRFLEAEEAWLAYRDANCDAEKAMHDGSPDEPNVEAACLAKLTDERRAELQRVYSSTVGK